MRQLKQHKPLINTIKAFEIVCGIIIIIGFFLVFGSIGGCEHGSLSEGRAIMYSVIGLVMSAAGALGVRWFSQFEDEEDDEDDE